MATTLIRPHRSHNTQIKSRGLAGPPAAPISRVNGEAERNTRTLNSDHLNTEGHWQRLKQLNIPSVGLTPTSQLLQPLASLTFSYKHNNFLFHFRPTQLSRTQYSEHRGSVKKTLGQHAPISQLHTHGTFCPTQSARVGDKCDSSLLSLCYI